MTIGETVIAELARRQMAGTLFDYKHYRRLRAVDSTEQLRRFLDDLGDQAVPADLPPRELVDALLREPERRIMASPWRSLRMAIRHPPFFLGMVYVHRLGGTLNRWTAAMILSAILWAPLGAMIGWHFDWALTGIVAGWFLPSAVAYAMLLVAHFRRSNASQGKPQN